jgi:hypothetical protein
MYAGMIIDGLSAIQRVDVSTRNPRKASHRARRLREAM